MNEKPKILVVDDVSSNIHLLMGILKEKYSIMVATNGKKALEITKGSTKPDLILMDVVMPEMDGYEVCENLKKDKNTSSIPVIFVTSLNSIEEQEKGISIGAVDFITKPFSKEIILHKINTHLKFKNLKNDILNKNSFQEELVDKKEKQSILVIDDSPENLQVVIEVLKSEYTVSVATSAKKAMKLLESGFNPDLILLDVIMPDTDGYEFCSMIKKNENYKSIPVIFITILQHEKDIVKGFELGAVDYVIKPIEAAVLKARVRTHLKLKKYQDSLIEDLKIKRELIYHQSKLSTLGEVFENITRQWKQPLSAISVSTSGMRIQKEYDSLDDENLTQALDTIDISVEYLLETINDFKDFIADDNFVNAFDVKQVIEKTIKLLSSKLKDNYIEIELDLKEVIINNYQNNLIQVLMNIIINSVEALNKVEKDRKILINSKDENGFIVIKIEDNAGGIEEEHINKIFDKYFTTKSDKVGKGIGLYMSKKLLEERMNGEIKVKNIPDGVCFEIKILKK